MWFRLRQLLLGLTLLNRPDVLVFSVRFLVDDSLQLSELLLVFLGEVLCVFLSYHFKSALHLLALLELGDCPLLLGCCGLFSRFGTHLDQGKLLLLCGKVFD